MDEKRAAKPLSHLPVTGTVVPGKMSFRWQSHTRGAAATSVLLLGREKAGGGGKPEEVMQK